MAINPMTLLRIRKMWGDFTAAHPRILPYFRELNSSGYIEEGSVIDITVTDAEGRSLRCNMKVTANDIDLIRAVADIGKDAQT
jgi:hypothetical protein